MIISFFLPHALSSHSLRSRNHKQEPCLFIVWVLAVLLSQPSPRTLASLVAHSLTCQHMCWERAEWLKLKWSRVTNSSVCPLGKSIPAFGLAHISHLPLLDENEPNIKRFNNQPLKSYFHQFLISREDFICDSWPWAFGLRPVLNLYLGRSVL